MGGGRYGGYGKTYASVLETRTIFDNPKMPIDPDIALPSSKDQLSHIFGNREGHLTNTKENRKLLINLANDPAKIAGADKYGNIWNISNNSDGSQYWVTHRNCIIQNGGKNMIQRVWSKETGLNNPFKKGRKK